MISREKDCNVLRLSTSRLDRDLADAGLLRHPDRIDEMSSRVPVSVVARIIRSVTSVCVANC
jgi:hypothetical protein